MKKRLVHLLMTGGIWFSATVHPFAAGGSEQNLDDLKHRVNLIDRNAMIALTSWSAGSILVSTPLIFLTSGSEHYFHIMNVGWNAVNLIIGSLGLHQALNRNLALEEQKEFIKRYFTTNGILLLNIGLDVAYMAGGGIMLAAGLPGSEPLLTGFGWSLILQGGFLLVFDLVYLLVRNGLSGEMTKILSLVTPTPGGIALTLKW